MPLGERNTTRKRSIDECDLTSLQSGKFWVTLFGLLSIHLAAFIATLLGYLGVVVPHPMGKLVVVNIKKRFVLNDYLVEQDLHSTFQSVPGWRMVLAIVRL